MESSEKSGGQPGEDDPGATIAVTTQNYSTKEVYSYSTGRGSESAPGTGIDEGEI